MKHYLLKIFSALSIIFVTWIVMTGVLYLNKYILFVYETKENIISAQPTSTPPPTHYAVNTRIVEPEDWYYKAKIPYAIISISSQSDERIRYSLDNHGNEIFFVKTECKVLFSHCINNIIHKIYGTPFDKTTVFYVPESVVEEMIEAEAVLVQVTTRNLNGEYYYTPEITSESVEYIPITENGLETPKVTGQSVTLDILYRAIDWAANNSRKAQYQKALPERKLSDGMSVEEVKDFFLAVEEATLLYEDVLNKMRTGRYDPAEGY